MSRVPTRLRAARGGLALISIAALALGLPSPAGAASAGSAGRAAAVQPAVAAVDPGLYTLRAHHSGKCFGPRGNSTEANAFIDQQPCDGRPSQKVRVVRVQDSQSGRDVFLRTDSGKCWNLSHPGGGGPWWVTQQPCDGSVNQILGLLSYHPWGGTQIAPELSGVHGDCLHVANGSSADAAGIIMHRCNPGGSGMRNDTFDFLPA
ncbi:RICIN domain-containing protein [Streptomyces sp. NPDC045714]|uniref:RICIN domain-containing protein n=1 Tax=Streptomyces sp. NPDC045714 TaxID=3154913 RepID=UPI0033FE2C37